MDKTKELIDNALAFKAESRPLFLDLGKLPDRKRLDGLFSQGKIQRVSDDYKEQQLELFGVKNPLLLHTPHFKNKFEEYYKDLQNDN